MEKEIWKEVKGASCYEVSNMGRIRSWRKRFGGRKDNYKMMSSNSLDHYGYCQNSLVYDDGKVRKKKLHRLIAECFIPNPDDKAQINHINSDRSDNRVSNLEWATQSENQRHRQLQGKSNKAVSKNEYYDIINAYNLGCLTQKELAKAYGVCQMTISNIVNENWVTV